MAAACCTLHSGEISNLRWDPINFRDMAETEKGKTRMVVKSASWQALGRKWSIGWPIYTLFGPKRHCHRSERCTHYQPWSESISDGCTSSVNKIFIRAKGAAGFHMVAKGICHFHTARAHFNCIISHQRWNQTSLFLFQSILFGEEMDFYLPITVKLEQETENLHSYWNLSGQINGIWPCHLAQGDFRVIPCLNLNQPAGPTFTAIAAFGSEPKFCLYSHTFGGLK